MLGARTTLENLMVGAVIGVAIIFVTWWAKAFDKGFDWLSGSYRKSWLGRAEAALWKKALGRDPPSRDRTRPMLWAARRRTEARSAEDVRRQAEPTGRTEPERREPIVRMALMMLGIVAAVVVACVIGTVIVGGGLVGLFRATQSVFGVGRQAAVVVVCAFLGLVMLVVYQVRRSRSSSVLDKVLGRDPTWARMLPVHLVPPLVVELERLRAENGVSHELFALAVAGHPETTREQLWHSYREIKRQNPGLRPLERRAGLLAARVRQATVARLATVNAVEEDDLFGLRSCPPDGLPDRLREVAARYPTTESLIEAIVAEEHPGLHASEVDPVMVAARSPLDGLMTEGGRMTLSLRPGLRAE